MLVGAVNVEVSMEAVDKAALGELVERLPAAVFCSTPQGKFIAGNDALAALLGFATLEEVYAADIADLYVNPRDRASMISRAENDDVLRAEEVELRRPDGSTFWARITSTRVRDDAGNVVTYEGVIEDVTDERTAARQLRAARAAAEGASKAKDEFLAGMSHELRTPLNAVIGLASILGRGTHGPLAERQRQYVEQIEASGRHLLALINDVLDLAKIQADRLELDKAPASLAELVAEAVALVRESAASAGLSLEVDVDPSVPELLEIDRLRIKQVLLNLLSNAIKFTPAGGKVGVEACLGEPAVELTVWDTGIGISKPNQRKLFQPFEQVDTSLTREQGGTGLGLALTRRLVELHGGTIAVHSAPGEGSIFTVRLPATVGSSGPDGEQGLEMDSAPRQAGTATVLVVEDNDVNRQVVTDYLESGGYTVVHAGNGVEAIEAAETLAPDVILMDVQLPVMDGLTATERIKARPDLAGIPVVALTALAMKGDAERCLAAGCDGYLSKPADADEVLAAVARQLRRAA